MARSCMHGARSGKPRSLRLDLDAASPLHGRVTGVVPLYGRLAPRAAAHPFSNGGSCPRGRLTTASGLRHPSAVAEYCHARPTRIRPLMASQLEPEPRDGTDVANIRAVSGPGDKSSERTRKTYASQRRLSIAAHRSAQGARVRSRPPRHRHREIRASAPRT